MSEVRILAQLDVNEGKEPEARAALEALVAATREKDTETLQYDACVSEDGRFIQMVERYVSAASLGPHMENVGERLGTLLASTSIRSLVVVGDVPDAVKAGFADMRPIYAKVAFGL